MPPLDRGGLLGTRVTHARPGSSANVVRSSDAIHVPRSIHRQALQYSMVTPTPPPAPPSAAAARPKSSAPPPPDDEDGDVEGRRDVVVRIFLAAVARWEGGAIRRRRVVVDEVMVADDDDDDDDGAGDIVARLLLPVIPLLCAVDVGACGGTNDAVSAAGAESMAIARGSDK